MFRRATITLGIGPHFSVTLIYAYNMEDISSSTTYSNLHRVQKTGKIETKCSGTFAGHDVS